MSSLTDSSAIFRYHRDMISMHGNRSSFTLGWRDRQSQLIRFKALASIADLNGRTVLDAGCGYADLFAYLLELYPDLDHYCGIEQIPELLDEAIFRYQHTANSSFISGNFVSRELEISDYVLASGSLNYRSVDPDFIFKTIKKLYNNCRLGLGFNLLRKIESWGLIVSYDPEEILSYCRSLCQNVVFIDDYDEDDFTVFMYRYAPSISPLEEETFKSVNITTEEDWVGINNNIL